MTLSVSDSVPIRRVPSSKSCSPVLLARCAQRVGNDNMLISIIKIISVPPCPTEAPRRCHVAAAAPTIPVSRRHFAGSPPEYALYPSVQVADKNSCVLELSARPAQPKSEQRSVPRCERLSSRQRGLNSGQNPSEPSGGCNTQHQRRTSWVLRTYAGWVRMHRVLVARGMHRARGAARRTAAGSATTFCTSRLRLPATPSPQKPSACQIQNKQKSGSK